QVGTYTWHASYSGDGLNNGALDQGGVKEQVKIGRATRRQGATATAAANGVVGSAVPQEPAVLSGGYNVSGGTITLTLTAPSGSVAYTQVVNVTAVTSSYATRNTIVGTQAGTYTWQAVYSGDALNKGASDQGGVKEQV